MADSSSGDVTIRLITATDAANILTLAKAVLSNKGK